MPARAGVVATSDLGASPSERVEPCELGEAECAGDVVEAVVEAELVHLLMPGAFGRHREAVRVAHEPDEMELVRALCDQRILGDEGAALAGREVLGGEEREGRQIREITDRSALVRAADRMRGVIEDERVDPCGRSGEPVVIRRMAGVVDGGDHLGALIDERVDRIRVDQSRVFLDIGEDDVRTEDRRHRRRGDEGHGRRDHGVTAGDPCGAVRHVERCRARGRGDRPVPSGDLAESRFEGGDRRTRREPVAAEHVDDGLDVVLRDRLTSVRQHGQIPASMISAISACEYQRSLLSER